MTMTDVKIQIPTNMTPYVVTTDAQSELIRNAMMLYPYVNYHRP